MAKTANDEKATRVLEPASIADFLAMESNAAIAKELQGATEVKDSNRVIGLVGKNVRVDIQTANTKVEEKKFDAEYVAVSAITLEGAALLMDGVVDETYKGEGDDKREAPSVVKYFNQGFGILGRNAAAARIRTKVEGPDKAIMQAAKGLARAKGWEGPEGLEKALAKIRKQMSEED
jgi:hypothetical protein